MEISDPRVDPVLVPAGSRAVVIAEHQTEYRDLPSIRTPNGQIITRWTPTDVERIALLQGEDIYVTILSGAQCPICSTVSHAINPLFVTVGPVDWS